MFEVFQVQIHEPHTRFKGHWVVSTHFSSPVNTISAQADSLRSDDPRRLTSVFVGEILSECSLVSEDDFA